MRTKTLLLGAAVAVAGISASQAQVYSVNAVGYVNTVCVHGFTMIANPLNTTNNTLAALIPTPPDFTTIYKWDDVAQNFVNAIYFFGSWDQPTMPLNPGEGCFVSTDTQFTITWVGDVLQGNLTNSIPLNYSIRSSKVPQTGSLTQLAFPTPNEFDTLYKWNKTIQNYDNYVYFFGSWSPSEPSVEVGESFFYSGNGALTWTRNFSVN